MSDRRRVVVVGAGAAGTLTAIQLLRTAVTRSAALEVALVDPAVRWARGAAFGTSDPQHLLNVPACGMSALPDQPDDFVDWRCRSGLAGGPHTFAPRMEFSRYLADTLYEARRAATGTATMTHRRTRATGLRRTEEGLAVTTSDTGTVDADAVVVATGLPTAGDEWAPPALRESPRFVRDPWVSGALDEVRRDVDGLPDVLLVGTGLTMVDVALTLGAPGTRARRLLAISRGGRLPATHRETVAPAVVPDVGGWGDSLASIRRSAVAHVEDVRRATGDWRPGVDGVRLRVGELWQRLDEADRLTFLTRDAGLWAALRHRIPPPSGVTIRALSAAGRLRIGRGEVAEVEPLGAAGLRIRLTDGSTHDAGWVVNCTGPRTDIRTLDNPFLDDLLRPRSGGALAVAGTAGMGLRTRDGRVVDGTGATSTPLWAVGALRRGDLWESTAVPEIRTQARDLAADILARSRPPRRPLPGGASGRRR